MRSKLGVKGTTVFSNQFTVTVMKTNFTHERGLCSSQFRRFKVHTQVLGTLFLPAEKVQWVDNIMEGMHNRTRDCTTQQEVRETAVHSFFREHESS